MIRLIGAGAIPQHVVQRMGLLAVAALLAAPSAGGQQASGRREVEKDAAYSKLPQVLLERLARAGGMERLAYVAGSTASDRWSALGIGVTSAVQSIAARDTDIVVGGNFSSAGGIVVNRVARWNGTAWSGFGAGPVGLIGTVYAVATAGNDVYAGGEPITVGGVPERGIAYWNGSTWAGLGTGMNGTVNALTVNGPTVYAGGSFTTAGGVSARNIARWNGSAWEGLGGGVNGLVNAILVAGGDVYVGGAFDSAGTTPARNIARWNGLVWQAVGGGTNGAVYSIAVDGSDVIVGGVFDSVGTNQAHAVARWTGTAWQLLGAGLTLGTGGSAGLVNAVCVTQGKVFAGGLFTASGATILNNVASWDGSTWSGLDGGVNSLVFANVAQGPNVYFGGLFTIAGDKAVSNIARWQEAFSVTIPLLTGWNLVSLPVVVQDSSVTTLFPDVTNVVFGFNTSSQGYVPADTLSTGEGYWVKYGFPTAIPLVGSPIDSIDVPVARQGWVILGSIIQAVTTASLVTDPPGSLDPFTVPFRWNNSVQAYEPATSITPGEGVWVKVLNACTIRVR